MNKEDLEATKIFMELHKISLKETFDLLIDSIINNKERPELYYKREYKIGEFDYVRITEVDLMDSRFKTIDCDFSEYEWELTHSNIYVKRGNTNETN